MKSHIALLVSISLAASRRMSGLLRSFIKCESGATAIEYGLIAAGISVAIIAVVNGLGTALNAKFKSISTQLN
jgi:pilus assembly protein Flp/PilA